MVRLPLRAWTTSTFLFQALTALIVLEAARAPTARGDSPGAEPLPPGAMVRLGTDHFKHRAAVHALAFSADGKRLASGGWGDHICLWEADTGKLVRTLTADKVVTNAYTTRSLVFSRDGKTLMNGSSRGEFHVWDLATGNVSRVFGHQCHPEFIPLVQGPGEKAMIVGAGAGATMLEWNTGKRLAKFAGGNFLLLCLALSPDGRALAAGTANEPVAIWDVAGPKKRLLLQGHDNWVIALGFSGDGKTLATFSRDGVVKVWNAATGRNLASRSTGPVSAAAFSADAGLLATGDDQGAVHLWEMSTGKRRAELKRHAAKVTALAFRPDGKVLASGSADNTIKLWDVAAGKELLPSRGHTGRVSSVVFTPDRKTVISASMDGTIRYWSSETGKELAVVPGDQSWIYTTALSGDGKVLASGGLNSNIRLWDVPSRRLSATLEGHAEAVYALAFSPDDRTLASGSRDQSVLLWDVAAKKKQAHLKGHRRFVEALGFAPHGKTLASVDADPTLKRWDVSKPYREVGSWSGAYEGNRVLSLSHNLRYLAGYDANDSVNLFEVDTGRPLRRFEPTGALATVMFSTDGRMLAMGGRDGRVQLWETASARLRVTFHGHSARATTLRFGPGDDWLASAGDDTTILLWDIFTPVNDKDKSRRPMVTARLSAAERRALWDDLASRDAAAAYRIMCALRAAPQVAVSFFKEHLQPAAPVDPKHVNSLIAALGSDSFTVRQKATAELELLEGRAEAALAKALQEKPTLEVKTRVEQILNKLNDDSPTADWLRFLRSLEVLRRLPGPEARAVIISLSRGAAQSRRTRAAQEIVGKDR
jgi:WD40 repeat protein